MTALVVDEPVLYRCVSSIYRLVYLENRKLLRMKFSHQRCALKYMDFFSKNQRQVCKITIVARGYLRGIDALIGGDTM